jgi:MFS transporter, DHA3 family, macrolide efflux protein
MSYRDLLRIRAFRNLWLGQGISQLGDAFYYVVFMFMVKKITGSIVLVGVVGALETLPFLLFGAYAGVVADRIDRRLIMLLSDLVSGLALALFAIVVFFDRTPPLWLMLATPFLLSSVRCFFMPAKSAAIPAIVPRDKLLRANALSMMTQNMAPLLGLSLTAGVLGLIFDQAPHWFFFICVTLNSASFFGSAYFIALLPKIEPVRLDGEQRHPLADFREGIAFIRRRHDLKVLIGLLAGFRLMVSPFFVVYVAANELWFGGRPQPLAWFEFAFFVGMIVSSFQVGKMDVRRPGMFFCWGLATTAATVAAMAFSPYFWLFVLWNVVAGLAVPFADIPINTYMQASIPDGVRGRVNSVVQMVSMGVMPIGMGVAGILIERVGVVAGFLIMGTGMLAAVGVGFADRQFRTLRMPTAEELPPEPSAEPVPATA